MTRRRSSSLLFGSVLVLATGVAFAGGARLRQGRQTVAREALKPAVGRAQVAENGHAIAPSEPRAQDFGGTFETVYALVKDQYYDALPSDSKMARGSVKQMIAALEDPNSYFLEPEQRKLVESEIKGVFSGIGAPLSIQSSKKEGYTDYKLVVVAALAGSPAEKAGLKSGDVITHIDGKWILGYDPMLSFVKVVQRFQNREADEKEYEKARISTRDRLAGGIRLHAAEMILRGDTSMSKVLPKKEKHSLTVLRASSATPIKVDIAFATTTVTDVSSKVLENKAMYLKIPYLKVGVDTEVAKALESFPSDCSGLVIDLRGTSGGSFEAMQRIAGLLAGRGPVALEVGANGKRATIMTAEEARVKVPLTVLVDQGTASTAEALAACLNERVGAPLIGEKTFGDALVQGMYLLEDGSGFTLTAGKLLSSKGIAWAGIGLRPQVALAKGTPENEVLSRALATLKGRPQIAGGKG